jgi:glycosyltransferase involved in cell wall biosynthesis
MSKYIIISPVRNEENYIQRTYESVVAQTLQPAQWVIVNDGSTDKTEAIVQNYVSEHDWIKLITLKDRGFYFPGTGVVNVFNAGMAEVTVQAWDFVVKLDVDLSFESNYFESLLDRFESNPDLGIASGVTFLEQQSAWVMEPVMEDHPVGPSKVYRRTCFNQIDGLKPVPGWDLADLLAAQMAGWQTVCFRDLMIKHYRPTGTRREGLWARSVLQGRFEYRHGYAFWYTFLKAIFHLFGSASLVASGGKIYGYTYAVFARDKYIFEEDMRKFLRDKQRKSFLGRLKGVFFGR